MARVLGSGRLSGNLGNVNYLCDGTVRRARRSQKAEFDSAPSMAGTRHNATEFGHASRAGKLLRHALAPWLLDLDDRTLRAALTSRLRALVSLDSAQPPGQRQLLPLNAASLAGFQFNPAAPLPEPLRSGCRLTRTPAGEITLTIPALAPSLDLPLPVGATHFALTATAILLNVPADTARALPFAGLPAATARTAVVQPALRLAAFLGAASTPADVLVVVVGLRYYQEVNDQLYQLSAVGVRPLQVVYAG